MERTHLCNFIRGYYEDKFCEIILNLGQWFRRCHLKDFSSGALAALLFSGVEPFVQFWKRASWGTFMWSYIKFGPVVQEMSFKRFLIWSSGGPPVQWSRAIMQFWKRASWGTFMWSYMKFGPVVQEEMPFKEKVYRRTDKDRSQYLTLSLPKQWWARKRIHYSCEGRIEKSVPRGHRLSSLCKPRAAKRWPQNRFFYPTLTLLIDSYNPIAGGKVRY